MQEIKLRAKGLYSHANDLGSVPEGALATADNVVIDREDVIEPRRGFNRSYGAFADLDARASKILFYQDYLFALYDTNLLARYSTILDGTSANFTGSGSWSAISGTYTPPTDAKLRHFQANKNLYFTSLYGIYKMDSYSATPTLAGAERGIDCLASVSAAATGTWLADDYRTAYRAVWGYKDANENLVLGAPGPREEYQNTAGSTKALDLNIAIPDGVTSNWFCQLYRAAAVDNAADYVPPSDEMGLVYETNPTAGSFASYSKSFAHTDVDTGSNALFTGTHSWVVGDAVVLSTTNTPPAPLAAGVIYYVSAVGGTYIEVSATYGGASVNITTQGSGTHTVRGAQVMVITDQTPDELRGATLYTSGTQEGLAAGNETPPLAKDVAVYKDTAFYANTKNKYRYFLTLLGTGTTAPSLVDNDTVSIRDASGNSCAFTADSAITLGSEDLDDRTFALYTSGSVSQDIRDTARSLTRVINRGFVATTITTTSGSTTATIGSASNIILGMGLTSTSLASGTIISGLSGTTVTLSQAASATGTAVYVQARLPVYAVYLSTPDSLPGQLMLETRDLARPSFSVISSNTTAWTPDITTADAAENDEYAHALCYSKYGLPEAVPLGNRFFVGSADAAILRIIPLRDSLFVFKEDGIYRVSGEDASSFRVDMFDSTTRLLAPESAVVVNSQIYALTDQGVVSVTESGVAVRSRAIESTLLGLQGVNLSVLKSESFAIGYDTERKYILWVPSASGDTGPTQAYVFNIFTNSWTRWTLEKTCGAVHTTDNKLYLGDADAAYVNQERKSYSFRDYVDFAFTTNITVSSGTTLTLGQTSEINEGDVIWQSDSIYAVVQSVDTVAGTVTVDVDASFTVAACTVFSAISTAVAWVPLTANNPGVLKQFRECTLLFNVAYAGTGTLAFTSDASVYEETEDVDGVSQGAWGLYGYGEEPWGGEPQRRPVRVYVPRNKQRCTQLNIEFRNSTGYANYQLAGISVQGNFGSEKVAV